MYDVVCGLNSLICVQFFFRLERICGIVPQVTLLEVVLDREEWGEVDEVAVRQCERDRVSTGVKLAGLARPWGRVKLM